MSTFRLCPNIDSAEQGYPSIIRSIFLYFRHIAPTGVWPHMCSLPYHGRNQWIAQEGVKPGERVIVEDLQKVRTGMIVDPKPFNAR